MLSLYIVSKFAHLWHIMEHKYLQDLLLLQHHKHVLMLVLAFLLMTLQFLIIYVLLGLYHIILLILYFVLVLLELLYVSHLVSFWLIYLLLNMDNLILLQHLLLPFLLPLFQMLLSVIHDHVHIFLIHNLLHLVYVHSKNQHQNLAYLLFPDSKIFQIVIHISLDLYLLFQLHKQVLNLLQILFQVLLVFLGFWHNV